MSRKKNLNKSFSGLDAQNCFGDKEKKFTNILILEFRCQFDTESIS